MKTISEMERSRKQAVADRYYLAISQWKEVTFEMAARVARKIAIVRVPEKPRHD